MCFLISTQTIDEPVRPEESRGRAKSGAGKVATFPLFSTPLFLSAGLFRLARERPSLPQERCGEEAVY